MYSEYAKVKALEKEQELKEREKTKKKQELAHQHYLILINENRAVIYAGIINYKEYVSSEERTELVRRLPTVLSELDLYSTKEICMKCRNLSGNLLNAMFDSEKFQKDYDDIQTGKKKDVAPCKPESRTVCIQRRRVDSCCW